jgi:hypothetical protein
MKRVVPFEDIKIIIELEVCPAWCNVPMIKVTWPDHYEVMYRDNIGSWHTLKHSTPDKDVRHYYYNQVWNELLTRHHDDMFANRALEEEIL